MNVYSAIHKLFRYHVQAPTREAAAMLVAGHERWAALSMVERLSPDDTINAARAKLPSNVAGIVLREPLFVVVRYCGRFDADTPEDELPPEDERGTCWRNVGHACAGHEVILDVEDVPQMSDGEREEQARVSPEHAAYLASLGAVA